MIPCFIILTVAYPIQVWAEVKICNTVNFENVSAHKEPKVKFVALDFRKGLVEDFSKFATCGIKFFSPVSAYCEEMPYQKTQQSCDRKQRIGNYFNNKCYRLSDLAVFFILSYLSATVIRFMDRFFYTTFNIRNT